ncbi:hypothetical protein BESB_014100 [Besnoitia besnoiti]|uniref:Endonuclease/exonuclease/phosphatase family protein n=1 Tax=Besnoitia besnoiti TaxID=94643 RepID=A0A2A9M2T6_BESBE|nr:hypothetical protein BESB_014100 [Besnoitia besnoiti]PFH32798.1 hypothetical protein BESB_014100 [Besnoitia besnoiti]
MFDVMILQFRDRRALQLIPEDITGQELWELANGGRAVTGRMEQLGRIVGSKLEYPVPVISCEEHQEASLETLKPAPFLSRSSTKASENDSEAMDVANSVEWDLQDSDSVPLLASPSPVSSVQTMAEARAIYEENVRQFSIAKSSDMASRMRDLKGSKPLNIVMLQWNTELFKPTPFEFLLPFCRKSPEEEEAPVIKLEGIDMFVVTTQENNRFSPGEELIMQDSILRGLNALSQIPNWKSSGLRQLNNARGTLLRRFAPFTPNTQMIMWFARDHAVFNKPPEFCMGSLKQSEKGFVAVKAAVEGVGNILIAGTHIGHRKSRRNQISEVLQMMGTNCGEEARGHTGLDDFSIVLLAGDFNSRLDLDSSRELLSVISKEPPFTSPFVGDSANPINKPIRVAGQQRVLTPPSDDIESMPRKIERKQSKRMIECRAGGAFNTFGRSLPC